MLFYVSYWRRERHFTWSYEPREGLLVCRATVVPLLLSYFETLSIGPATAIEPATFRSAGKRSTDWAYPAAVLSYLFAGAAEAEPAKRTKFKILALPVLYRFSRPPGSLDARTPFPSRIYFQAQGEQKLFPLRGVFRRLSLAS